MSTSAKNVKELIRFIDAERVRQGLSKTDLAERSGLDTGTISRILALSNYPSVASIEKLAKGLGYDFTSLLLMFAGKRNDAETQELIEVFQRLSPERRQVLLEIAHGFLAKEREAPRS